MEHELLEKNLKPGGTNLCTERVLGKFRLQAEGSSEETWFCMGPRVEQKFPTGSRNPKLVPFTGLESHFVPLTRNPRREINIKTGLMLVKFLRCVAEAHAKLSPGSFHSPVRTTHWSKWQLWKLSSQFKNCKPHKEMRAQQEIHPEN